MNPRFMYMPYPTQQYPPYRLPGPQPYCLPYYHQPDLGMQQFVYVHPYPQMPVVPCDPYAYGQSMPLILRPTFQPPLAPPRLVQHPFPDNLPWAKARRSTNQPVRNNISHSRTGQDVKNETRNTRLDVTDAKQHVRVKEGLAKASVSGSHRRVENPTKAQGRKAKVKRFKKKKSRVRRSGTTRPCQELSSIYTDSTQTRSTTPLQQTGEPGEDDDYETYEEEDVNEEGNGYYHGKNFASRNNFGSSGIPLVQEIGNNAVTEPVSMRDGRTRYVPIYSAKEDYWAAVSGVESPWNRSNNSVLCQSRGNACKCKMCTRQGAKLLIPPTPDLWWDRSIGMELWPPTGNSQPLNLNTKKLQAQNEYPECVVIDTKKDGNVRDEKDGRVGAETSALDNADSNPRRRLLSVDWNSILKSNLGDSCAVKSNSEIKIDSITEVDSAIVERGPLATEPSPFALHSMMQASLNDTLRRLKSTSAHKNEDSPFNRLTQRIMKESGLFRPGVREFFQTAFTSNDICNSHAKNSVEDSENTVQKTPCISTKLRIDNQDNQRCVNETARGLSMNEATAGTVVTDALPGVDVRHIGVVNTVVVENLENAQNGQKIPGDLGATGEAGFDKETEDTDIPPDSIENAANVEQASTFQFPVSNHIFRDRAAADSTSPGGTNEKVVTGNKKFYEDSKPTPFAIAGSPEDVDEQIQTAPSSPVSTLHKSLRRSFSLNDIRGGSDPTVGLQIERPKKGVETTRVKKKPPIVPTSTVYASRKNVNAIRNADACDRTTSSGGTTSTGFVTKVEKPRRTWRHNANRKRYPTGIPLNGMLNDTIRRNFRQNASPVAIFELYRPPADLSKISLTQRPPSIDDWSDVMVQPVPVGPSALVAIDEGRQTGCNRLQLHNPQFISLPVMLYPTSNAVKPKLHDDLLRPRPRRHVLRRRNSLSAMQPSAMYTRKTRTRKRDGIPAAVMANHVAEYIQIHKSYQSTRTLQSQHSGNAACRPENVASHPENAAAKTTESLEYEKPSQTQHLTTSESSARETKGCDNRVNTNLQIQKNHISGPREGAVGGAQLRKIEDASKGSKLTDETNSPPTEDKTHDDSGKKLKESFLKRFMKRKKLVKRSQVSNEGQLSARESLDYKMSYQPNRKPSRQEKLRANFASKKNRLLGRNPKPRLKGLSSCGEEDCNANSSRSVITTGTKKMQISENEDTKPGNSGKRLPKEDKNMKYALYRPTLICMAAIETSAPSKVDRQSIAKRKAEQRKTVKGLHCKRSEQDSLPGPINQGREEKSVVGTPGVRINSETGDIIETSDAKLMSTFLCSTKIAENENAQL